MKDSVQVLSRSDSIFIKEVRRIKTVKIINLNSKWYLLQNDHLHDDTTLIIKDTNYLPSFFCSASQLGIFLCEYIIDVDNEGNTALHLAVSNRHIHVSFYKLTL